MTTTKNNAVIAKMENLGAVCELLRRYLDDRVQIAKEARALMKAANARIRDIRERPHSTEPHQVRELIGH